MNDLGPRSMDGFARPNRPVGAPQAQQQVRPVAPPPRPLPPRPIAADPRRVPPPQARVQQPVRPPAAVAPKKAKSSGGWKVALQFVIGLLIIIGVAAAIVVLYIRYYQ